MPSVKDRLGAINDQVNSDKYRPPVFVILGTAKPITTLTADQAFDVLKIDNDICPHHLCILLPPLRRGDRASREQGQRLIEGLYEKVKPDDSSGLWRPRRPIRAIYIHDVQLEGEQAVIDEDDRRQHAQLDFAVELIGTIRGKPLSI